MNTDVKDNSISTAAMVAGARSAAMIDEDIACAMPELCTSISSTEPGKFLQVLKGKFDNFMSERRAPKPDENKKDQTSD
ncbi:13599_t:CDS:2 [Funneliformis caledonium]|uniref:13599_t:CDS:1 n=1 Tax=Funneliformis caledonium TaxID=1117310 RepID=A0A9N8W158_9GLOM|nr:13599_t:CDS:2 [Funneliformis caledonium]